MGFGGFGSFARLWSFRVGVRSSGGPSVESKLASLASFAAPTGAGDRRRRGMFPRGALHEVHYSS